MFFRVKPAKGYRYLQIARSVRRGKTVRQEIIATLGRLELLGNRFRPSGALARSLKLEAVISMGRGCQMGLWESSSRHFEVRGAPRTPKCLVRRVGGLEMQAARAHPAAAGVLSFPRTPVLDRNRGRGRLDQAGDWRP